MILDDIVRSTRLRIASLKYEGGDDDEYKSRSLVCAIKSSKGNAIISEVKFRSPSSGEISLPTNPVAVARRYEVHGAAGLSVLTEPVYFGGSPLYLSLVRENAGIPVLRKDFIIDERQIHETRRMHADAVLLIAALLGDRLAEFVELAEAVSLQPLVEVHTDAELDMALATNAKMIGINNRNLKDMKIDTEITRRLGPLVMESGILAVSESGIRTASDVAALKTYCDAFLVGTSLMSAPDPGALLEAMVCV